MRGLSVRRLWLGVSVVFCLSASSLAWGAEVKRTSSGLCHPGHSPYYERIKNYQGFASVAACLAAGGRLPKGVSAKDSSVADSGDPGYERSAFGHGWLDFDRDGQDARAEALIDQSTVAVRFATSKERRVVHGRWVSPFSGKAYTDASELDADHVVPLKFAWEHGADKWDGERRRQFANDQRNILIVEASLNRSKGARDILQWLPPAGQCGYIARFVRIVRIYKLEIPPEKEARYNSLVSQCRSEG